jgi:F-type H+-transporting ATPase subunit b
MVEAASNFLLPNMTFVVELIAFIIVLGILGWLVLPPLDRALTRRQEQIRVALEEAERARQQVADAQREYERKLEEAREEARKILQQAERYGEQLREELKERGQKEYEAMIARAKADIELAAKEASDELKKEIASLVVMSVERILEKEIDHETHRKLIEEVLAQANIKN